jgi:HK97 family phage major capsid protein
MEEDLSVTIADATNALKIGAMISQANKATIQAAHDALTKVGAECKPPEPQTEDMPADGEMMSTGNALKAISQTDDELRVGNYITLFGGRDLTGIVHKKNKDGSSGEYFSKNTDLESDYTKTGILHVDFEHGLDPDNVGNNSHNVLGYVDWKTAKIDDKGVFVQRVLNRRNKYMQFLEELIQEGLVGNSSQAIQGQTQKNTNGEIIKWPLYRDTLTVSPMEPRMLSKNAFTAVKALAELMPSLKSLLVAQPEAAEDRAAEHAANVDPIVIQPTSTKDSKMDITQEQLDLMVENASTKAVEKYRKSEPAVQTPHVTITTDEAEQPFKSAGEYFKAVRNAALDPKGEDKRLRPLKATGMSEGIPADGGYLVIPQYASGIIERMYTTGAILSRVSKDPVTGNTMIYNGVDETSHATTLYGGLIGYWLSEGGTKVASAPKFRQMELKLKKVAALAYCTDEMLEDIATLDSWLNRTVPNVLKFMAEDAIVEGNGVGKPQGILNSNALITVTRDTTARIMMTDIVTMWSRRWAGTDDYVWIMGQDAAAQLPLMAGTYQNTYMPPGGLSGAPYATLYGKPIIESEYAQALNTKGDIMLASLSQYQVITKGDVKADSSIHVAFTTDETAYRFVYRIDGQSSWNSAFTPLHGSNTVSPFVVLGSASA